MRKMTVAVAVISAGVSAVATYSIGCSSHIPLMG
jgi:hypothetical protein